MLDGPDNKVTPRLYNLSRPSPCKTRFVRFGSAKRVNGVSKKMEGDQKSILDNIKNGQPHAIEATSPRLHLLDGVETA